MTIEKIAKLCHEINRIYCSSVGDNSQLSWEDSPEWQRQSVISGVKNVLRNPELSPEQSHENWLREKLADGWTYGSVKNPETKTHPCCVSYSDLPKAQKFKDSFFITIVKELLGEING